MRVTDHAILRFAQYALELDVSAIQKQLTGMVTKADGDYPIGIKNLRARVKDGAVVTVVKAPRQYRRKRTKVRKTQIVDIEYTPLPLAYELGAAMDEVT